MKNSQVNFYNWLREKHTTSQFPSLLDDKILKLAQDHLRKKSQYKLWVLPVSASATLFVIIFFSNFYFNQEKNKSNFGLIESPEMVLLYENIELMADATKLSDSEWKKIEGIE